MIHKYGSVCWLFLLSILSLPVNSSAETWPDVFDPLRVLTLNFEVDPDTWEGDQA